MIKLFIFYHFHKDIGFYYIDTHIIQFLQLFVSIRTPHVHPVTHKNKIRNSTGNKQNKKVTT